MAVAARPARCNARPKAAPPSGKRSGRGKSGRGWSRTSGLLFVRQALIPSELLAREPLCGATVKWVVQGSRHSRDRHGGRGSLRPAAKRGRKAAHPSEKRSGRGTNGRGWSRTSSLFLIREALCLLSFPPMSGPRGIRTLETTAPRAAARRTLALPAQGIRDKESNLDLHVQSVASYRLDDPGMRGRSPPGAPAGQSRNATCRIARAPCSVFIETRCQPRSTTVA